MTTQRFEQSGLAIGMKGNGWLARRAGSPARGTIFASIVALMLASSGWAGLGTALAASSSGTAAASDPAAAQAAASCRIPTDADRAPLTDGTSGGTALPGTATPVADPESIEAAIDIDLVIRALATCLTAGDYETVAELASGQFLGVLAGTGGELDDATYLIVAADLPTTPFRIRSISAIST